MKYETSARRLREAMDDMNITATELSKRSGVGKSSISHYMNGTHAPSNISSAKLSNILGVNPVWLMGFAAPKYVDSSEPSVVELYESEIIDPIIRIYNAMNHEGRTKLLEYAQDLYMLDKYHKEA